MAPHPNRPRRPSTAEPPSTQFQRAPMRSQTAPVRHGPPSAAQLSRSYSIDLARPPSRTGTAASLERQTRLRAREEDRVRRDTSAVEMRITHTHDVLMRALETVAKNANKESQRIRYDLQRLVGIVESGMATIVKDAAALENMLRRDEARVVRDFQFIRQIQDPRKRGPELDRLEAALEESEKQIAYEYSRLQAARSAENERAEVAAAALAQARRNEEPRLIHDIQRLNDARSEARRKVDDELSALAHRGLTECDLPSLHVRVQALRDRQKDNSLRLDAAFAKFNSQRAQATAEINLEARRITDMRRENKRALDSEMARLANVRSDCKLRIDKEIERYMQSAERFSRASKPQPKPAPKVQPQAVPPRTRRPSYANPYTARPQPQTHTQYGFATERIHQQSQSQQARDAWLSYEERWAAISNNDSVRLNFHNIPWPVFSPPQQVSQLNTRTIGAFILSSLHEGGGGTRRERVRNAMRLWHPDKWMARHMAKVDPRHAQVVRDGVNAVAGALTELLASA
ncbi:hypothetical protein RhiJN_09971 [Ceratobasidium sp. AG-Ba]|nr:hypothetical protein RhiJN_09971 [Ceratobasidium sp. AG-Ba]QRW10737.1 hypothetical protein RhiLY_09736 [Ceratobasidium sp. AG-Ba]